MSLHIGEGSSSNTRIDELVLDAGPLVTQQPLQGLATKFYIPPAVVAELRDHNAKEHLERLRSTSDVQVREPGPEAVIAVINFAKKTGDYSVLSRPDLSVLALTYALEVQRHGQWRIRQEVGGKTGQQIHTAEQREGATSAKATPVKDAECKQSPSIEDGLEGKLDDAVEKHQEALSAENKEKHKEDSSAENGKLQQETSSSERKEEGEECNRRAEGDTKQYDHGVQDTETKLRDLAVEDTEGTQLSEDDEEVGGEWITPDNISKHKSRALGLVTEEDMNLASNTKGHKNATKRRTEVVQEEDGWSTVVAQSTSAPHKQHSKSQKGTKKASVNKPAARQTVACMTGDYAVQNVILQMGMSLVGVDGQRIRQVKSWVLRCHACFKICKDSERKFCPHCGNPTLLRTSVTSTAPDAKGNSGVQVHLKKNFQYKNRGTKFSLPLPKQGKAGGAPQAVPILREDQIEWQRGLQRERVQRGKEERALQKALEKGSDSLSARYEDVDELSILLAGKASSAQHQGLPPLGVGRKNPNEKHRRKV